MSCPDAATRVKALLHDRQYQKALPIIVGFFRKAQERCGGMPPRQYFDVADIAAKISNAYNLSTSEYDPALPAARNLHYWTDALGNCYFQLGCYDKSYPLLWRAVEMSMRLYGAGHTRTSDGAMDLAFVLFRLEDWANAAVLYAPVIEIRKQAARVEPTLMVSLLSSLTRCLTAQKKYTKALPVLKEALDLSQRTNPVDAENNDHPTTQRLVGWMADCLHNLGLEAESLEYSEKALRNAERNLGRYDKITCAHLERYSEVLINLGRYDEAESMTRENVLITRQLYGAMHLTTLHREYVLARCLVAQNSPAAKKQVNKTLGVARSLLGRNNNFTRKIAAIGHRLEMQSLQAESDRLVAIGEANS